MGNFGRHSTTDDVLVGVELKGKRIFITGVSAGLGVETARALVSHGANVVGAARDLSKGQLATEGVRTAAQAGGGSFELVELDLASLASVRACSAKLVQDGKMFDIVIANAGVMATPSGRTSDGFETQFGTNHLGHFLMINRLEPLMADNGRVVILSSSGHRQADIDLDDPNFERTAYDPWKAYGRSKTANALFAVEFDRRYRDRGIRACSVMPGLINTKLGRHMTQEQLGEIMASLKEASGVSGAPPLEYKTVQQGAATSVWAAILADGSAVGGRYCENCGVAETVDDKEAPGGVRSYALDADKARRLWTESETLVSERF